MLIESASAARTVVWVNHTQPTGGNGFKMTTKDEQQSLMEMRQILQRVEFAQGSLEDLVKRAENILAELHSVTRKASNECETVSYLVQKAMNATHELDSVVRRAASIRY